MMNTHTSLPEDVREWGVVHEFGRPGSRQCPTTPAELYRVQSLYVQYMLVLFAMDVARGPCVSKSV